MNDEITSQDSLIPSVRNPRPEEIVAERREKRERQIAFAQERKERIMDRGDQGSKISNSFFALMVSAALLVDGIQAAIDLLHFIPFVGNVFASVVTALFSVFVWVLFYIAFKTHGVNFSSPKRMISLNGAGLLELIPVLNALPAWTLAVVLIVGSMRAEELAAKVGVPKEAINTAKNVIK